MGVSTHPFGTLVQYLQLMEGIRAVYPSFNRNEVNNGLFALSIVNNGSNMVQWDSDIHLSYTNLIKTSTQYLTNGPAILWSNEGLNWSTRDGLAIGMWIRITSHPGTWMGLFSAWRGDSTNRSWKLFIDETDDSISAQISSDGTTLAADVRGDVALPIGEWIYVSMRWKPSTYLNVKAYFGGKLQEDKSDTSSIPSTVYYDTTLTGYLGAYRNSSAGHDTFNGDIGVAYYGVVNVDDEVDETIYQLGRQAFKV